MQKKHSLHSKGGFHLCVLGAEGSGKSSLIVQFISKNFLVEHDPTIEDNYTQVWNDKGIDYTLQIKDTGNLGSEQSVQKDFRWAQVFILCFSITSRFSFELLPDYRKRIQTVLKRESFPLVVVGTHGDKEGSREVPFREAKELCNTWKCPFFETSAATGYNVEPTFRAAVNEIMIKRTDEKRFVKNSKARGLSLSTLMRRRQSTNDLKPLKAHSAPPSPRGGNFKDYFSNEVLPLLDETKKVPRWNSLRRPSPSSKRSMLFGISLEDLVRSNLKKGSKIPDFATRAIAYLSGAGPIHTEGIFRVSPNNRKMMELMELLDKGIHIDFNQAKDCDCHIVASILKSWLKQLPNPVLTFELYEEFLHVEDSVSPSEPRYHLEILKLLLRLPKLHRALLFRLLEFLREVAEHSEDNKMNVSNLATLFAPCLLYEKNSTTEDPMKLVSDLTRTTTAVNHMIENCHKILEDMAELDKSSGSGGSVRHITRSKTLRPVHSKTVISDIYYAMKSESLKTRKVSNADKSILDSQFFAPPNQSTSFVV